MGLAKFGCQGSHEGTDEYEPPAPNDTADDRRFLRRPFVNTTIGPGIAAHRKIIWRWNVSSPANRQRCTEVIDEEAWGECAREADCGCPEEGESRVIPEDRNGVIK
jgi:hypothetical protein